MEGSLLGTPAIEPGLTYYRLVREVAHPRLPQAIHCWRTDRAASYQPHLIPGRLPTRQGGSGQPPVLLDPQLDAHRALHHFLDVPAPLALQVDQLPFNPGDVIVWHLAGIVTEVEMVLGSLISRGNRLRLEPAVPAGTVVGWPDLPPVRRPPVEHICAMVDTVFNHDPTFAGRRAGQCELVNGTLALVLGRGGWTARVAHGWVDRPQAGHTWLQLGRRNLDLAGAQFDRPPVYVFASDPGYHRTESALIVASVGLLPESLLTLAEVAWQQIQWG